MKKVEQLEFENDETNSFIGKVRNFRNNQKTTIEILKHLL